MLSKEITHKVKGQISEETVCESVDQFFRHGSTFLLVELMRLRSEVKTLREELEHQRDNKAHSLRKVLFPEML